MVSSRSIVLLFALLASAWTQDCNNPLLARFNLTGLTAPQSGSGLQFCSNLQNGQTCCSADTVNEFQSLLNTTEADLLDSAGSRDAYLAEIKNNYLAQFDSLVQTLGSYSQDITAITALNRTLGNNITNETNFFQDLDNSLSSIESNFNGALRDYQAARVTCFQTLLQVQGSAWCLACDPNYADNGVLANGTIVFSDALVNSISTACFPFLQSADSFNPLVRARESFDRLQNLTDYLTDFDTNNVIPNRTINSSRWNSTNATERTVAIPAGCTGETDCTWQAANLFSDGLLNRTIAANGAGVIGGNDTSFGTLGFVNVTDARRNSSSRLLQSTAQSAWTPDLQANGFTVADVPDPAGIFANSANADNSQEVAPAATTTPAAATTPANTTAPANATAPANTTAVTAPATTTPSDSSTAPAATTSNPNDSNNNANTVTPDNTALDSSRTAIGAITFVSVALFALF